MTHTLRTDLPLLPGLAELVPQAIFLLDTGDSVAVHVALSATTSATLACVAAAWLVDEDGDMQAVAGNPVAVRMSHVATVQELSTLGAQGIADALRDLLLGEAPVDPPVIAWSDELREQTSIRNVITVARAAGTPIDWSAA